MKKTLLSLLLLTLVVLQVPPAGAVQYQLNLEYSGGTSPAGPAPWLTATLEDVASGVLNTVQLTLSASGLSANEFISSWYFNFNPQYTSLVFPDAVGGNGPAGTLQPIIQNAYGAGPAAGFDIEFDFPTAGDSNTNRFSAGETVVYTFDGIGLTAADFNYQNAGGAGPFFSAAHVQSIGSGSGSGWIGTGGDTVPVPEPSGILLLGMGFLALNAFRQKRS